MQELIDKIKSLNLIETGDFTLRSGKKSKFYIDLKKGFGDPDFLPLAVNALHKVFPKKATCVAGMGYGGIPLATQYSTTYKLPLTLIREKPKSHGTKTYIEAYVPQANDTVVIIDDIFTTGSSLTKTAEILSSQTNTSSFIGCVVIKRTKEKFELPLYSALNLEDLIK